MNNQELLSLLRPFTQSSTNLTCLEIKGVTSNLQDANDKDLVFYRLSERVDAEELLKKRLQGKTFGMLLLNRIPNFLEKTENIISILDEKFLAVQKSILDVLYPLERQKFKIVGITGTNGKTTSVCLAMQISTLLGHPAISVGTLGVCSDNKIWQGDIHGTTPSYIELRKIFHQHQNIYHAFFVEVSSHALEQERLYDLQLDFAGWTSFSQDHLDYHHNMEQYFQSKTKVITKFLAPESSIIVPAEEKELFKNIEAFFQRYKRTHSLDVHLQKTKSISERGYHDLPLFFQSGFNRNNLELALDLNEKIWGSLPAIPLEQIAPPRGRFSIVPIAEGRKLVVIDYAHTPDALENICKAILRDFPGRVFTVVFGCGGDRDRSKRAPMGSIAAKYADKLIVTSDNPRSEDPDKIIADILAGIEGKNIFKITDRQKAILNALKSMEDNGILLIAGKGHEDYQEIKGMKYPYSDFAVVDSFNKEIKK
ncbi:MAG: UDP-N-acetylmuramoyl-L-alanyl-D-glutamate--2,6-diaminopimelate ligase [Pseudomonadota bacterium]